MSLCALNSFGVSSFQNVQMCNLAHNSQNQRYNLDQFNNTRNFSVIDYSKPGNRLYERTDGSIGIIPKTPAEVLGEVLRPMIDKTISLGKGAFGFISKSFSYLDTRFSKMIQILPGAKATDVGQIAYFEGDCPDGWENYIHGQERFILGAGGGYTLGSTGGEFTHTLTIDEMPKHNHGIQDSGDSGGSTDGQLTDSTSLSPQSDIIKTSFTGGNQPHNNMPPYIVLRACKKLEDSSVDLSSYAKVSDLNVYIKQSTLSNYALKSEIPSLSGYAKTSDLNSYVKVAEVPTLKSDINTLEGKAEILSKEFSLLEKKKDNLEEELSTLGYAKTSDLTPVKDDVSTIKANYALKSEIPSLTSYTSKTDFTSVKEKLESKVGEIEELKEEASSSKLIAIIAAVASGIQFLVGLGVLIWNCATKNAHKIRQESYKDDAQNQRTGKI